jgi:hypothetical protein
MSHTKTSFASGRHGARMDHHGQTIDRRRFLRRLAMALPASSVLPHYNALPRASAAT